jgi:hypothetical protein
MSDAADTFTDLSKSAVSAIFAIASPAKTTTIKL